MLEDVPILYIEKRKMLESCSVNLEKTRLFCYYQRRCRNHERSEVIYRPRDGEGRSPPRQGTQRTSGALFRLINRLYFTENQKSRGNRAIGFLCFLSYFCRTIKESGRLLPSKTPNSAMADRQNIPLRSSFMLLTFSLLERAIGRSRF